MKIDYIINGRAITLPEILEARDKRAALQRQLLNQEKVLISFTLNIPGPIKKFGLTIDSFNVGKASILAQLKRNKIAICNYIEVDENTGIEGLWVVKADALIIKKHMAALEEYHPLGRIFDIDVISANGEKIDRTMCNFPERKCFICSNPVFLCSRARKHSVEDLVQKTVDIMGNYFINSFCDKVASNALKSLLYEISITPKPGLIDRKNNGAHKDMDFFTFTDSTSVLYDYFKNITLEGYKRRAEPLDGLLDHLQYMGLMAEEKMYDATNNVNTHKGAIYSLGILCAAYGYLYHFSKEINAAESLAAAGSIARKKTEEYLSKISPESVFTKGDEIFIKYSIKGARGEAAAGFPTVKNHSLPALHKYLCKGWDMNTSGIMALLCIMATIDDTNIINRSNIETMAAMRNKISSFINKKDLNVSEVIEWTEALDKEYLILNISPGGAADLLIITFMAYFMEQDITAPSIL